MCQTCPITLAEWEQLLPGDTITDANGDTWKINAPELDAPFPSYWITLPKGEVERFTYVKNAGGGTPGIVDEEWGRPFELWAKGVQITQHN